MFAKGVSFCFVSASCSTKLRTILGMTAAVLSVLLCVPSGVNAQPGCCTVPGNINCDPDGRVTIGDVAVLIDHLFINFTPLCCPETGNTSGDPEGVVNIGDVALLIDHLFINFLPLAPCAQGELTFAQREIVFNAVDSAYNSLDGRPADSVAMALAAFLNTLPEIDSAGVIDSVSVWAWFTDGRIISIPNNRFPTGSGNSNGDWPDAELETSVPEGLVIPERRFPDLVDPTTEWVTRQSVLAPGDYDLPSSIQARVISTLGAGCFTIGAPIIKKLLEDHGYVTVPSTGSVSSLFGVTEDGLYYIDAHGGSCRGKDGAQHLAIWTATTVTAATDSAYRTLLNRNELVYMWATDRNPANGNCESHKRYAYTGRFVAQYMYFVPNSYIFINACYSDSVASLRQGFFTAGASVFCGWTKTVNDGPANKAAEFLFDRMLGANESKLSPKETPPQRSFDVERLWSDMKNRGYDFDPTTKARLRVQRLQNHFGLLAPSIRSMTVIEHTDTLSIIGMFGSDPGSRGRVIVGGTELLVLDWQPDLITAFIPNTGAGSAGPVTVEVDGLVGPSYSVKRKSNVVNLTEWRGPITYTHQDAGSLTATITVDAHWRGDIHRFRLTPHTAPIYFPIVFGAADDSYGTVTAGGEYRYTEPGPDPTTYTWTWSGSDFVKAVWNEYPNWFTLSSMVMVDTHKFQLMAHLIATTGIFETKVSSSEGFISTLPFGIVTPFELYDSPPWIYIDMSNSWEILAGHRPALTCCSEDPDNEDIKHDISWPTILPYYPPDTTAAQ